MTATINTLFSATLLMFAGFDLTVAKPVGSPIRLASVLSSTKVSIEPDRLLPAEPQRFVHFDEKAPHYVFDTICFHHGNEFHVFYLNAVFPPEGGRKVGVKWSHVKTIDYVHSENPLQYYKLRSLLDVIHPLSR